MNSKKFNSKQHKISKADISPLALEVLAQLRVSGYESQLVGGCVRDLMLGLKPKDFDVTTNASPEEIKGVFHKARLVGRRFRLAHIRRGREIIEVSTYRANPDDEQSDDGEVYHSDHGRLLSDNVYGTQEQDAVRRDFTINALYYDASDETVIDYVGGVEDLEKGILKIIGDPDKRYREDPVRMLRAVRIGAKVGFQIEAHSADPILRLGSLLSHVPPARLYDEVLKLFHHGAAFETFKQLRRYDLFQYLFPLVDRYLNGPEKAKTEKMLKWVFTNTDARVNLGKPVIAAFLFSVLLWLPLVKRQKDLVHSGNKEHDAFHIAKDELISNQSHTVSMPRRMTAQMYDIWAMQPRLESISARQVRRLLEHRKFRAAYDFLLMRGEIGEVDQKLCDWWTRLQEVDVGEQEQMIRSASPTQKRGRRRRPKRPNRQQRVA
ncbi:polynucleotide adenylyltransferase PcnB [Pseudomonadota bacterium]